MRLCKPFSQMGMVLEDESLKGLCLEHTGGYPISFPCLLLSRHQQCWGLGLISAPLPGPLKPRDRPRFSLPPELSPWNPQMPWSE